MIKFIIAAIILAAAIYGAGLLHGYTLGIKQGWAEIELNAKARRRKK